MKASVLLGINDLRYTDIPIPQLHEDEVMVNVKACGICGSDVNRVFKTGTYHFPTVIGHEFSGIVTKVYNDCDTHWIGKRVGVFPLIPCKECRNCKDGNFEMCVNYDYLGSRSDGGFEEYVAVPSWNLIELPDNVSFEEGAMLEPTSVAIHALSKAGELKGKSIIIIGPGTIGNIISQIAKYKGASLVVMIGRTPAKLELSKINGVDVVLNSEKCDIKEEIIKLTNGKGVDIVIEGTGSNESIQTSISTVSAGGRIVLMGNPFSNIALPKDVYWKILRHQLTLIGTWNSSFGNEQDNWHEAINAISNGKINLRPLISHILPFNSLMDGLNIMRDRTIFSCKVILRNDET